MKVEDKIFLRKCLGISLNEHELVYNDDIQAKQGEL